MEGTESNGQVSGLKNKTISSVAVCQRKDNGKDMRNHD